MTKGNLTFILLSALFFSCEEIPKQETSQSIQTPAAVDNVVTGSATNKEGQKLDMTFNISGSLNISASNSRLSAYF